MPQSSCGHHQLETLDLESLTTLVLPAARRSSSGSVDRSATPPTERPHRLPSPLSVSLQLVRPSAVRRALEPRLFGSPWTFASSPCLASIPSAHNSRTPIILGGDARTTTSRVRGAPPCQVRLQCYRPEHLCRHSPDSGNHARAEHETYDRRCLGGFGASARTV